MDRKVEFWLVISVLVAIILILVVYNILNYTLFKNSDIVNIFLTSALVFFGSVEAVSTIDRGRIEKKRRRSIDLRNELEKLYGPVYSILNTVVYSKEMQDSGILLPDQKTLVDKKFSKYPHMIEKELYDYWKEKIQFLKEKSDLDNVFTILENANTDRIAPSMAVYFIPKTFILKFIEEYDKRVNEYRKQD